MHDYFPVNFAVTSHSFVNGENGLIMQKASPKPYLLTFHLQIIEFTIIKYISLLPRCKKKWFRVWNVGEEAIAYAVPT